MSKIDQCPSTIGDERADRPRPPLIENGATGRVYWRSLEELADTKEFREHLEREFPPLASVLNENSRRDFLRVMGASLALAGVATIPGCRRPDTKIIPYARDPEDVIHGKALYYATALPLPGGGAEGLLAEAHEGRPTKLEGNPLHPMNQGKSSAMAQASVLNLYDPDRLVGPSRRSGSAGDARIPASWAEFEAFAAEHFKKYDANRGQGLAFLVEKATSPSRDAMRDRIKARWPEAKWLPYEAVDNEAALEATRAAFGAPHAEVLSVAKAKVIVTLDRDFLAGFGEGSAMPDVRGFAAGRRVRTTHGDGSDMNRLYAVESVMTLAGAAADHRLRLRPSEVSVYAAALALSVFRKTGTGGALAGAVERYANAAADLKIEPKWIDAVAQDLVDHRGESLVVAGAIQPAGVHALAYAMNLALGNIGKTVAYTPLAGDAAASSLSSISTLAAMAPADTVVVIGCNPVYDAPADLELATKYARIPMTIHLGLHADETAHASTWRLNRAHYLETWGDVDAADGTRSVVQPLIRPIEYEQGGIEAGRGELELLAIILGDSVKDPYEIVRRTWREAMRLAEPEFEKKWKRTLHDGLLAGTPARASATGVNAGESAALVGRIGAAKSAAGLLEVVFRPHPFMWDGRFANNGWLQELPHPLSKTTWDNPALISPATAERLKVTDGQMIALSVGGLSIDIPVFRSPGVADDMVVLELGYGRTQAGRIGDNTGFNTYRVRTSGAMRLATGATAAAGSVTYKIACVQQHWAMEGRPIVLETDVQAWREHGDEVIEGTDAYGRQKDLRFADRVAPNPESHTPANVDIYRDWQLHDFSTRPQWGMSIDLTSCVGCAACTIACQAENNIPVVGKSQVLNGREMHWIRVDRYYVTPAPAIEPGLSGDFGTAGPYTGGRTMAEPDVLFMPVPCMQCENAPCETVCPVNATVHGTEGLNEMAYNRCIGTRYCSNNCPYKVRRFNYFDFATKRLNGNYFGKSVLGGIVDKSGHKIPPRLREKINDGAGELQTLQYNPDVTVRERGVMEKCTYCVQRINEARVDSKLNGLAEIPEGFFQTACQQACPADAIAFGDILNAGSRVAHEHAHGRTYSLLSFVNARPRTRYMLRLRNPNPAMRDPAMDPFGHGHEAGHDDHGPTPHDAGHVMSLPVLQSPRAGQSVAGAAALSAIGGPA